MAVSYFVRHWWWAMIIVIGISVLVIKRLFANPLFRAKWDNFKAECAGFWKAQSNAGFVAFYADICNAYFGRRIGDKVAGYGQL